MVALKFAIITFCLVCFGCNITFRDDSFLLKRKPYYGKELRIDGFYFHGDSIYKYNTFLFFFENGLVFKGVIDSSENKIDSLKKGFYEPYLDNKINWGLYNIYNHTIEYEFFYPGSGGILRVYNSSGTIINDTNFIITKSIRSNGNDSIEEYLSYHFKKYLPKPDSKNDFIKLNN